MIISLFQSFYTDEDTNLMKKFKLYVDDNWNKCDMVTIFLFVIGVTCRYISVPCDVLSISSKGYVCQLTGESHVHMRTDCDILLQALRHVSAIKASKILWNHRICSRDHRKTYQYIQTHVQKSFAFLFLTITFIQCIIAFFSFFFFK